MAYPDSAQVLRWFFTAGEPAGVIPEAISLSDYDPASLSASAVLFRDPQHRFCFGGMNRTGDTAFLAVFPGWSVGVPPNVVLTWPSSGGSRTTVTYVRTDDAGLVRSGRIIFCDGAVIRILDEDLAVIEEATIDSGEPIDIGYMDGSIWLAYPDHLLKSNRIAGSDVITSWETVPIPAVTALGLTLFRGFFDDKLVVLDGVNESIYILNPAGEIMVTLEVGGRDLERGDVMQWTLANGVNHILLVDGIGQLQEFVF